MEGTGDIQHYWDPYKGECVRMISGNFEMDLFGFYRCRELTVLKSQTYHKDRDRPLFFTSVSLGEIFLKDVSDVSAICFF